MDNEPTCSKCKSTNWRCWDERYEWFEDKQTHELEQFPVGYLACNDCGHAWIDYDELDDYIYIGDDREAFGEYD